MNNKELIDEKLMQIWYIAALFHDIGYVYEAFTESWNNLAFLKNYPNFKKFYLDIEGSIAQLENNFEISTAHENLVPNRFVRKFDHAEIGACLISNLIGESNLVCDIAALITDYHTSREMIKLSDQPLSFLLVLLDEVQEWGRPSAGKRLKDVALSEKIERYSPYIEKEKIEPELESISYSYFLEEVKSGDVHITLDFLLDYKNKINLVDKTDFSYPMMLYLKYRNFQRLRIENQDLKKVINKYFEPRNLSNVEFNISLNIKSSDPLSHLWDRQCNILAIEASNNKNLVIKNWLNEIGYREIKGEIKFDIGNLPIIFTGDFTKVILSAHETYMRDSYIIENYCELNIKYDIIRKNNDELLIKGSLNVERHLTNSKKDIYINGFYACIDEPVEKNSLNVDKVFVDNKKLDLISANKQDLMKYNLLDKVILWGLSQTIKRDTYRENLAMFVPFKSTLSIDKDEPKRVSYVIQYSCDFNERDGYDGIFNARKRYSLERAKLNISWPQILFNEKFKCAIVYKGKSSTLSEFLTKVISKIEGSADVFSNEFMESLKNSEIKLEKDLFLEDAEMSILSQEFRDIIYLIINNNFFDNSQRDLRSRLEALSKIERSEGALEFIRSLIDRFDGKEGVIGIISNPAKNGYYEFIYEFENIKPYNGGFFIWINK